MSRLETPPVSVDVAAWLSVLPVGDVAFIAGCAMQRIASDYGITELDLFRNWVRRAERDPDCQVVRE